MNKHFLTLRDHSKETLLELLSLTAKLKAEQKSSIEHHLLKGKSLAMIFQKPSNRTRVSFEVGMFQLGGKAINIRPSEIQMGEREPIADIARVISRYVDLIMLRVLDHDDIIKFAEYSAVPVINGLSDRYHPCQAVADMFTIREHRGSVSGVKICYVGDGNNVCNSLINAARHLDAEITVCCPEEFEPLEKDCKIVHDPSEALKDAGVVYTDVWASMGQESETDRRLKLFEPYKITSELLSHAADDVLFMHCLPAKRGQEVEDEVVESQASIVFDQAENRLHAQKAIMCTILG